MQDFRNLKVWEKAHALTLEVYRKTRQFPADERYGLTSQLRRSSASVAANLAEGCARGGDIDFARFVNIAAGSASETDYHLLLARDLEYFGELEYKPLIRAGFRSETHAQCFRANIKRRILTPLANS